jgi:hypothetical protein
MAPTLEVNSIELIDHMRKDAFKREIKDMVEEQWRNVEVSPEDKRSVEVIRGLVLDCCQQHGIGHGGQLWSPLRRLWV